MSYLPRAMATATAAPRPGSGTVAGWLDLVAELDRWTGTGRAATLWWRDDDAVTATPQLDRLLRVAAGIPLALAVIPARADLRLADALAGSPDVAVLQHGWRHANHARHGKNSEYPNGRLAPEVTLELAAGRERLAALFGARALPVLVPPWNRFAEEFLPLLPQIGIAAISAMPSHCPDPLPSGLVTIDVHVDLVAWRGDRGFVGETAALGVLIDELRARRLGARPINRPIGLLTHHLVTDGPGSAFIEQLIAVAGAHKAVRWAAPAELLR